MSTSHIDRPAVAPSVGDAYHARLIDALGPRRLAELEDDLEQMAAPIGDSFRGFPG